MELTVNQLNAGGHMYGTRHQDYLAHDIVTFAATFLHFEQQLGLERTLENFNDMHIEITLGQSKRDSPDRIELNCMQLRLLCWANCRYCRCYLCCSRLGCVLAFILLIVTSISTIRLIISIFFTHRIKIVLHMLRR